MTTGWGLLRNGRFERGAFAKTKRSLLIGFDMMPLMGLRRMERRLVGRGRVPTRCIVQAVSKGGEWCWTENGSHECRRHGGAYPFLEFGGGYATRRQAVRTAALFYDLPFGMRLFGKGKREQARHDAMLRDTEQQLKARGVVFCRVRLAERERQP